MKKQIIIILLVLFCLIFTSCEGYSDDDISRSDERMESIIADIGVSDEEKLVVKKPYDTALDCIVYLIYVKENGAIKEYTCEFYETVYGYKDAMDYYDIRSVKKIYSVVSHDEEACMVCVVNTSVSFDSLDRLTQQFSDPHYIKHGYEIIK